MGGMPMDQTVPLQAPAAAAGPVRDWLPPPGWCLLGSLRGAGAEPEGCHLLAHPDHGAMLLDLAPEGTPDAEARLGRTLERSGFAHRFPGTVPVWYVRLEPDRLPRFAALLREALAGRPPVAMPRNAGWIAALRQALRTDPTWVTEPEEREASAAAEARGGHDAGAPLPRRATRPVLMGAASCGIFLLGLAAGQVLSPADLFHADADAVSRILRQDGFAATASAKEAPRGAGSPGLVAPSAAMASGTSEAPPVTEMPPRDPAAPMVAIAASVSRVQPMADDAARAGQPAALPPAATITPPAGGDDIPPAPPPLAAPAPPRVAARRPAAVYDRRCAEAQFRWQQGERLSWADMAYVRQGCAAPPRR